MKINGDTKCKLYEDYHVIKTDKLCNIIGYLYNRGLIELPEEYWIEYDNGWKSTYHKNFRKIANDFDKLTHYKYKLIIIS